jgi:hypothetical protein
MRLASAFALSALTTFFSGSAHGAEYGVDVVRLRAIL